MRYPDMTDPDSWDEDDVRWLRDRGKLPADYEVPESLDAEAEEYEDYEEGWTNDSRKEELAKRGLSTEGKKDELIARLIEDDEKSDEDDEDEDEDDD